MTAVLAIDQGTSGTKAIVVDHPQGAGATAGVVLAAVEVPIRPAYLGEGRVEQDPAALLASVLDAGRQAMAMAGRPVGTVSLANQGETVLAWDPSSGRPLSSAIVWQDARAQGICDELAFHRTWVAQKTGLVLDPYFSAPKMAWLRRELTGAGVVTTTDSWLLHHLTGEFVTDVATASRSLLMNLDAADWDPELVDIFGLEGERLPRIVDCDEKVGTTSAFGTEMTVAGQIVDQPAALLGQGCLVPGEAKCTFGTGAFLLANTGGAAPRSTTGLTTSVGWRIGGTLDYCIDGQVFTVASAVRWLADLGLIRSAVDLDDAAAPEAAGVICVPAFAGLAAPWWRSDATASFTGISLSTGAGHLVRAVIDGIAAQIAELTRAVATDLGAPLTTLRVDGGLTHSTVLMQAVADLTGLPVQIYPSTHASALGAAALGRLATQPDLSAADAVPTSHGGRVFEPGWSVGRAEEFLDRFRRVAEQNLPAHELPIKEYP